MNKNQTLLGRGHRHQQVRARVAVLVNGGFVRCCRGHDCTWAEYVNGQLVGGFIVPGTPWDLDHTDNRLGYLGAAHAHCNRSAGARKRNRKTRRSRAW